jgi:uncharacterized membrane protein YdjX (TVP38/TMEM64 family)
MQLRRFFLTCLGAALVFLGLFALFSALGLEGTLERYFSAPRTGGSASAATGAFGVLLLVLDVFLPVPSSVVMLIFGKLFGVAVGAALSLVGCVGATGLGIVAGRSAKGAFRRLISEGEYQRAVDLLARFGSLAVLVTRPVPILAETVALVAGATGLPLGRGLLAGLLGSLPGAVLYAWAGAADLDAPSGIIAFCGVLLLSALGYWFGRRAPTRREPGDSGR